MSEVAYAVIRNYGYSGYEVKSVWLNAEDAVRERDLCNGGELPDDEPGWKYGDQSCLNFQVYEFPLNRGVAS